jgi:hypothetical protein
MTLYTQLITAPVMTSNMRFNYIALNGSSDRADYMPYAPISLKSSQTQIDTKALIDSGAMVNVLPYDVGLQLGFLWEKCKPLPALGGNLSNAPSVVITTQIIISDFKPVRLVFAWSRLNDLPIILGGTNFFNEFEVHFYRFDLVFEIYPKPSRR